MGKVQFVKGGNYSSFIPLGELQPVHEDGLSIVFFVLSSPGVWPGGVIHQLTAQSAGGGGACGPPTQRPRWGERSIRVPSSPAAGG